MLSVLRSLVLIGLLFWSLPASAQWEGRTELDNWIMGWVNRHYPVASDDVASFLADPAHALAEEGHSRANERREDKRHQYGGIGVGYGPVSLPAFDREDVDTMADNDPGAQLLDTAADLIDLIPPRFKPSSKLPGPDIKKPGKKLPGGPTSPFDSPASSEPVIVEDQPDIKKEAKKQPGGPTPFPFGDVPSNPTPGNDQPDIKKPGKEPSTLPATARVDPQPSAQEPPDDVVERPIVKKPISKQKKPVSKEKQPITKDSCPEEPATAHAACISGRAAAAANAAAREASEHVREALEGLMR